MTSAAERRDNLLNVWLRSLGSQYDGPPEPLAAKSAIWAASAEMTGGTMAANEMVVRVTRAICLRSSTDTETACCGQCGPLVEQARAAIEAMRQPTGKMLAVGECEIFEHQAKSETWSLKATKDGWQVMIEEALRDA